MAEPLLLLEGIFDQGQDGPVVHDGAETQLVATAVDPWMGRSVEANLHHLPPDPIDRTKPGGGSCLWGGHCPHGHRERPGWLLVQTLKGEFKGSVEDGWTVGGERLRFDLMPGHRGRFLLVGEIPAVSEDATPDDLVAEAAELASLLEALQQVIKK